MTASDIIRTSVAEVNALRTRAAQVPALYHAVRAVKAFQATRFRATYADLLATPRFEPAVLFFLNELYSDKDYTQRDAQFVRIAGPLERLFPASVVDTAVAMAQLHAITERLDSAMAQAWLDTGAAPGAGSGGTLSATDYVQAWRQVGAREGRDFQLATVLRVGQDLVEFTRKRGLRTLLRMMRPAARASGLGALQSFLEAGFDTFSAMSQDGQTAHTFLGYIRDREGALLHTLYADTELASAVAALTGSAAPAVQTLQNQ
ncbi:MAG: hypothetical protein U1E84_08870 [Rhodoferax sp.]